MSEVISFDTRKPYVSPEPVDPEKPCVNCIEFLEKLLQEAKDGKVQSFAALYFDDNAGWFKNYVALPDHGDPIIQLMVLGTGLGELQRYCVSSAGQFGSDDDDDGEDAAS